MRRRVMLLVAIAAAALPAACLRTQPISSVAQNGEPQALGSIALFSQVFGRLTILPSSCTAGDRQLFLGADFGDEKTGVVVRLVVDPLEGPAVRAFTSATPLEKSVVFRRAECRVFHFSLESTGWRVNRVQDYRVTLDLDCSSENGDSIAGKIGANHCH